MATVLKITEDGIYVAPAFKRGVSTITPDQCATAKRLFKLVGREFDIESHPIEGCFEWLKFIADPPFTEEEGELLIEAAGL